VRIADGQSFLSIPAARLRRIAATVLVAERVAAADISLALVDNATIHALNRQHLGHDYATDVLSFLFDSVSAIPNGQAVERTIPRIDGEVIMSAEMAVQMSKSIGWSPRDELTLYLVHGLLHLCGYDDVTPSKRRQMRTSERTTLESLGIRSPAARRAARARKPPA
jgi:probable rRNA maturation factor